VKLSTPRVLARDNRLIRSPGAHARRLGLFCCLAGDRERLRAVSTKKVNHTDVSIAGEKASAAVLGPQMKLVAIDVKIIVLPDTGHWLMEERPKETMDALLNFL
jgi:pimeloyl-ACP methyl ester carboxylesterase